jgi:hypothetical protein
MELSIKLTEQECGCLKSLIEFGLRELANEKIYAEKQQELNALRHVGLISIQRKLLFEMSKIQCPYCESHVFVEEQAEKLRKCLECGNEFECG